MADKRIDIDIKTSADTKGAQQAAKDIKAVGTDVDGLAEKLERIKEINDQAGLLGGEGDYAGAAKLREEAARLSEEYAKMQDAASGAGEATKEVAESFDDFEGASKKAKLNLEDVTGAIEGLKDASENAGDLSNKLLSSLEGVDENSDKTKEEIKKLSTEVKKMGVDAGKSAELAEKLAKGLSLTREESKQLERTLNSNTDSFSSFSKDAEDSSESFLKLSKAQRESSDSAKEFKRDNAGSADVLDNIGMASSVAESAIGNLSGKLGRLGPVISTLSGPVSGAVTSFALLVTGVIKLSELLEGIPESTRVANLAIAQTADRQLEASKKLRESNRLYQDELGNYSLLANEQLRIANRELESIQRNSSVRAQVANAQKLINEETLKINKLLIKSRNDLSEAEKQNLLVSLESEAQEESRLQNELDLNNKIIEAKQRIATVDQTLQQSSSDSQSEIVSLTQDLEEATQNLEKLEVSLAKSRKAFTEQTIPELDRLASLTTAEATVLNPLRLLKPLFGREFGSPDREDFDSDKEFIIGLERFLDNRDASNRTKEAVLPALEQAQQRQSSNENIQENIEAQKAELEVIKSKIELEEKARKDAVNARNEIVKAGQEEIEQLETKKNLTEQTNKLVRERQKLERTEREKSIAEGEISSEAQEIIKQLPKDLEKAGAGVEQLNEAKKQAEAINKEISDSLDDGIIDSAELTNITQKLDEFRRLFTVQNQATLTNISDLIAAVNTFRTASDANRQQIHMLQSQIGSK